MSDHYYDDPVDERTAPKPKRSRALALLLLFTSGSFFVSHTFSANVSLNAGGQVEFGQGTLQTVSCAGSNYVLTLTPYSSFYNSSGGGSYYFESMTVSNIPSNCNGVDFQINAYSSSGAAPLSLFNTSSTNAIIWNNGGSFEAAAGTLGMTVGSNSGAFSIRFANPVALSSSISKITIQSGAHNSYSLWNASYNVGDIGPGGGKIIYVSNTGFAETGTACNLNCHYIEVAPNGWNGGSDPTRAWAQTAYTSTSILLSQSLGYGYTNTAAIINQGNSDPSLSAAALAASYAPTVNGVTINDWFLPSEGEQAYIVSTRIALSITVGGGSWNSSSVAATNGRFYNYVSTGFAGAPKATMYTVRPVRVF